VRIAMVGSRGVPARYSGIERHIEELGARLADAGHEVVVFCHGRSDERSYRGMHLRHLPIIPTKHLETISHTTLSTAAVLRGFDIVHYHAIGPGLLAPVPRYLSKAAVVQTIHGRDGERDKWGRGAKAVLSLAEWASARVPNTTIVVSATLRDHYARRYGSSTVFIPNGVIPPRAVQPSKLDRFGVEPHGYVLFVGRLVPEKAPHLLIDAYKRSTLTMPLLIVGGSAHTDAYVAELERQADTDPRIHVVGPVYGEEVDALFGNAALFVSPSNLEAGAPITVLEAAAVGTPVLVSDIEPQRELVTEDGPGARLFSAGDESSLVAALERSLLDPDAERAAARARIPSILAAYDWDMIAAQTIDAYEQTLAGVRAAR
jgi:glycosyltransferase involved in cell wall biosynthesis